MRSGFSQGRRNIVASSRPRVDEVYDMKGLNQIAPDQVMPEGETPFTINSRRYARNENDTRVAVRTRLGSINLSTPVGETLDTKNTNAVIGDLAFSTEQSVAFSFVAGSSGALTKLAFHLKKASNTGGHVIVEVRDNNSGMPGQLIAKTSIKSSDIGVDYGDVETRLMDAPAMTETATYWCVLKAQRLSIGTYYLAQTAGSGLSVSTDDGATWTAQNVSAQFKTYISTLALIKGYTKRYPSNKNNRTMFALGTNVYAVPDNPTVPVVVDSNIHLNAQKVRFAHVDNLTVWTDGIGPLRQWDGDDVINVPGAPLAPSNVIVFKNRMMVVPSTDPTLVKFSALYDFKSWPSVNFFYVPRPKSPDPITGWVEFQDNLVIFTHETKHVVFGSDISTFTRKEAIGTKGAVSQEAMAVDRNNIYFMADDKMIYAYNGSTDRLISGKVEPELQSADPKSVHFHIYRNQLRVYYEKAATGQRCMLLLDIEQDQWFKDTGRNVLGSIEWTHNDNELVEFSSRAGWIFQGETGNSDLGKAIDFKYWTAYKNYGSGAAKDRIKRFRPIVRPADSQYYLKVGRDVDFNDTPDMRDWLVDGGGAVWGSFVWGDGTKYGGKKMIDNTAAMSGRGKHTQYRFEHDGVDQPVELYGYIALVKSGRPR